MADRGYHQNDKGVWVNDKGRKVRSDVLGRVESKAYAEGERARTDVLKAGEANFESQAIKNVYASLNSDPARHAFAMYLHDEKDSKIDPAKYVDAGKKRIATLESYTQSTHEQLANKTQSEIYFRNAVFERVDTRGMSESDKNAIRTGEGLHMEKNGTYSNDGLEEGSSLAAAVEAFNEQVKNVSKEGFEDLKEALTGMLEENRKYQQSVKRLSETTGEAEDAIDNAMKGLDNASDKILKILKKLESQLDEK